MKLYEALVRSSMLKDAKHYQKLVSMLPATEQYAIIVLSVSSNLIKLRFLEDEAYEEFEVRPCFISEFAVHNVTACENLTSVKKDQIQGLMKLEVNSYGELLEPEKRQEFKLE